MVNELDLLTEEDAAHLLRLSPKTLQRRRFDKKPPAYLNLNGSIRYRLSDLKDYLENCLIDPEEKEGGDHE